MGQPDGSNATSTDLGPQPTQDCARPKLLFVSRKWAPAVGGMETYSVKLSKELEQFADVKVDALQGNLDGSAPSFWSVLVFGARVAWSLTRHGHRHDIIHIADMASWPLAALARLRTRRSRVVLSAHGTDVSFPDRAGALPWFYGQYMRIGAMLVGSQTVVANSQATAAKTRSLGFQSVVVVPLATDMERAEVDIKAPSRIKKLLFAGRLVPGKGLRWFVEQVLPKLPEDVSIDVAGTVWDAREEMALADPRVTFLGALTQEDLRQAYARADCVIIPNIETRDGAFEGFGLVAAEAASAGALVLAAAHTGLKDAVIDGETGLSIPPGDPGAWTDALLDVLSWSEDKRAAFIDNAVSVAKSHYSWSRVAAGTFEAYGWTG